MLKKNIIIIGPAHPLRAGGMSTYNELLAKELMAQGHDVTIYTFSLQYPSFLFPGTSQYSNDPAPKDLNILVKINSINPFNWFKVGNEIKKARPDLVITRFWIPFMGPCFGTILRRIKTNHHTRVICIADNIIPHEKRPGDALFTRYFIKPVDGFITMSENVNKDLKSFSLNKPSLVAPLPLLDNFGEKLTKEQARKNLGIDTNPLIVLFFGFIRKYKGLDILFDAAKLLKDQGKLQHIKFLIAGEFYGDRKVYDDQISELGIADNLIMRTEFIENDDVKNYFCAADVVIQPYRNATQSAVTPIAYHFEIPMIVTNVGGLPALVPDGKVGLVAEPDAASLAKKIAEYFSKGEAFFTPHLIEEKKKYSWLKFTESIFSLANMK